jgi:hypothetical protein
MPAGLTFVTLGFCLARRQRLVRSICLAVAFVGLVPTAWAKDVYLWSRNVPVAPFADSRQQGETALTKDAQGRIWLSFIDAAYKKTVSGAWIAWPRRLRLYVSTDAGKSFSPQPDLTGNGWDQALASNLKAETFATYLEEVDGHRRFVLRRLGALQVQNVVCLLSDNTTVPDQSSVHIGEDDVIHVVATDIAPKPNPGGQLLYARSTDNGKTCVGQRRLPDIGELPQIVDTRFGLLIVGPSGYFTSVDHGVSFSRKVTRAFGVGLTRSAVSPDRRIAYAVGDSTGGGLRIHVTADGGKTWRVTRVDDAARATAWRYPAVHVDANGRVHVAWMDDRRGFGAIYHAYSDDTGAHFSPNTRVSDAEFYFPANAPAPPPATQQGTWIGDYLSLTTVGDRAIIAWSDQRAGTPKSVLQMAVGGPSNLAPSPPLVAPQTPSAVGPTSQQFSPPAQQGQLPKPQVPPRPYTTPPTARPDTARPNVAGNQNTRTENLRVALGDTIAKVRAAYGITADPIPTNNHQAMLRAPSDGLTFFFNEKELTLRNIRADVPFSGSINGVRIGDTFDDVVARLGRPYAGPLDVGNNKAYVFRVSPNLFRAAFNNTQKVETMFEFVNDR